MGVLPAICLLVLAGAGEAGTPPPGDVRVLLGEFEPGVQPDGNSVVFPAPEGLVVVDTGRHPAHTRRILDLARASGQPVAVVVNTHWHLDHVGGNPAIRAAFPSARVTASSAIEEALGGFLASYRKQLAALVATTTDAAARARYQEEISRIDAGRALAPDVSIEEAGARTLAGRRMVVGLERLAVTAADVWIHDPASGLLAAGDLVTLPAPLLDTACPRGWQAALARLSQVPFTLLVPGHGPLLDRAGLERYRTGFGHLLDCAASSQAEQACVDGWLRDLGPLVPPERQALARALLAYYLPNVLRGPPEVAARACQNEPGGRTVR